MFTQPASPPPNPDECVHPPSPPIAAQSIARDASLRERGGSERRAERYLPSFACTARFDQMRAERYFPSHELSIIEGLSDARTKLGEMRVSARQGGRVR